ncbi:hypothetical protein LOK49_LG04G00473 [Camellia lanceoleosa]|uniref:Uncharacterized protein n=1 Tax=Camellia lanceoleosa TaxID=1840588 RepID=A0ACC0HYI1_9ERIC|nr:hypothetical protein LOK49_LG04G00473 [Camellia lanceoleosa]
MGWDWNWDWDWDWDWGFHGGGGGGGGVGVVELVVVGWHYPELGAEMVFEEFMNIQILFEDQLEHKAIYAYIEREERDAGRFPEIQREKERDRERKRRG